MTLSEKQNYDPLHYHRHSYYEIFLFEKGGGTHVIDFETFEVKDHSVHVVSPGQIHMLQRELNSSGSIILFSREFYHVGLIHEDHLYSMPFMNNNTAEPIIEIPDAQWKVFNGYFNNIGTAYHLDYNERDALIRGHLNILLLELKRLYLEQNLEVNTFIAQHDVVRRFRIEIEQQFSRLHKPKEYADRLCITVGHLNDRVKTALGVTASDLINERLILEIKRMLLFDDLRVSEIASSLNFDDTSYFNRFFRQHTNQTPSEFRKEIRLKLKVG